MGECFRLHSRYNPQKEADNFASSIKGCPLYIVITEPAESYLALSFRNKFPHARLLAIRYTQNLFLDKDCLFDYVWREGRGSITFFLINHIPDEYFSKTIFLSWAPSDNVWKEESKRVWQDIKNATQTFIAVLRTRSFFGKTWAKNIFRNIYFAKNIKKLELKDVKDSIFLTSGQSLEDFIKDKRVASYLEKSFIVSASSSLASLSYHNIKPHLSLTTDGGYWAKEHLKRVGEGVQIFPLEGNVPYHILKSSPIAFLNYGSPLESYFFTHLNHPFLIGKRNGTVSGTAIDFLLENTKGNIFISGLDLSFSKGFSHARPNENLENALSYESRLKTLESMLAISSFSSTSLATYATWFSSLAKNKKNRLFRIGYEGLNIEGIKRISKKDFFDMCRQYNDIQYYNSKASTPSQKEKKICIFAFFDMIKKKIKEESFFESIMNVKAKSIEKEFCQLVDFPSYVSLIKEGENAKDIMLEKIRESVNIFIKTESEKIKEYEYNL